MRRTIALFAAGLVGAATIAAAPAQEQRPAPPTFSMELGIGDTDAVSGEGAGVNPWNWVEGDSYHCEETPYEKCEVVLIRVENPYEEENAKKGRERANLNLGVSTSVPNEINDFAIRVYESDEDGNANEEVGYADGSVGTVNSGYNETMTVVVTSTPEETVFWYRVEVIFWSAAGDWELEAGFTQ